MFSAYFSCFMSERARATRKSPVACKGIGISILLDSLRGHLRSLRANLQSGGSITVTYKNDGFGSQWDGA